LIEKTVLEVTGKLFENFSSKKELFYASAVVGITMALFSVTQSVLWLFVMAFLLLLAGVIFRPLTKMGIIEDLFGTVMLCVIFFVCETFIFN
jgi:hypothetical protein